MRSFFMIFILVMTCTSLSFSFTCDDTYYAQNAVLVTLEGDDINAMDVVSVDTLTQPYNAIPHLDTLLSYKIPVEFTSSCKEAGGFPYIKTPVGYLTRDSNEVSFTEISEDMLVYYYDEVNLGPIPLKDAIFIKEDTNTSASEYIILDTLIGEYTAVFGAAILRDTLRSGSGSFKGLASGVMPWFIATDTSQYMDILRTQWSGDPCDHDGWCDDLNDVATRRLTVQLVTVYYIVIKTLTISSPNGGEIWEVDGEHDISWASTGAITEVKLEYSTGNGWNTITASTENDGSYNWIIPDDISATVTVRVSTISGDLSDESNAVFEITPETAPKTTTLPSPNGSEVWDVGTANDIPWTSTGDITNVKIEYQTDGNWIEITSSTPNDGSFNWTVPDDVSTTVTVRISTISGDVSDESDADFEIAPVPVPETITLTSPNGSEVWEVGTVNEITWTSTGDISEVKIEYSTGEDTWHTIANPTDNTGSYDWTVPDAVSDSVKIRISTLSGDVTDECDAVLEIIPVSIIGRTITGPKLTINGLGKLYSWSLEGINTVNILDLKGRQICEIPVNSGNTVWNRRDRNGQPAGTGIYLVQLLGEGKQVLEKVVISR